MSFTHITRPDAETLDYFHEHVCKHAALTVRDYIKNLILCHSFLVVHPPSDCTRHSSESYSQIVCKYTRFATNLLSIFIGRKL